MQAQLLSRRQALFTGVSSTLAWLSSHSTSQAAESSLIRYENPQRYAIEHQAIVTNGNAQLQSLEVWLPVPKEYPEQSVGKVSIEPKARILSNTTGPASVAQFLLVSKLPGPGQTRTVKVSYPIEAKEINTDAKQLMNYPFKPYRKSKYYLHFTRAEKCIETNHPKILEQAKKLQGSRRSAVRIAKDAYEWVLDQTRYQLIDGLGGAAYCLEKKHGECGDYSSLFVALCRAAGVPARPVVGMWANQTNGWHVWAEFQLPTGEWIPVDGSIGDQSDRKRTKYFGNLDNQRVALTKAYNLKLRGVRTGHSEVAFLQIGQWWWTGRDLGRPPKTKFHVVGKTLTNSSRRQ